MYIIIIIYYYKCIHFLEYYCQNMFLYSPSVILSYNVHCMCIVIAMLCIELSAVCVFGQHSLRNILCTCTCIYLLLYEMHDCACVHWIECCVCECVCVVCVCVCVCAGVLVKLSYPYPRGVVEPHDYQDATEVEAVMDLECTMDLPPPFLSVGGHSHTETLPLAHTHTHTHTHAHTHTCANKSVYINTAINFTTIV